MLVQMGSSESVADNMIEFIKAMNAGKVFEQTKRDAESTPPARIENLAQVCAMI